MSHANHAIPSQVLRTMQIVAGALLLGLLTFLLIVSVITPHGGQGPNPATDLPSPVLLLAAAAMGIFCVPASFVLPNMITRAALRQIVAGEWKAPAGANVRPPETDADKLLMVRQTTMIIGLAMLEGTGFFSAIIYMLTGQVIVLTVVAVVVALMLARFPTQAKVSAWLEQQMQALTDLQRARQLGMR